MCLSATNKQHQDQDGLTAKPSSPSTGTVAILLSSQVPRFFAQLLINSHPSVELLLSAGRTSPAQWHRYKNKHFIMEPSICCRSCFLSSWASVFSSKGGDGEDRLNRLFSVSSSQTVKAGKWCHVWIQNHNLLHRPIARPQSARRLLTPTNQHNQQQTWPAPHKWKQQVTQKQNKSSQTGNTTAGAF